MTDIFISYSRKDSAQALGLAEQLRSNGIEVWIDQQGVEAVTTWSAEIEQAIKECKAFCLLLSRASLESNNVVKETSLATEFKRSILLIELYAIKLTDDFHSQFAGFQRVALTDFDAILLALKKLGIGLAPPVPLPVSQPERMGTSGTPELQDSRKSLIVLPFEDLSPPGEDNAWFADGLTGEMIDVLGHIKSLRILDRNTSLSLRGVKLRTVEIGKEFNTRYFIEGSVRKFGDQLKISAALLDIETGDYLWQESLRGVFKDIFDIQEAVAAKVVIGLKLTLTKEEKTLVQDHGTENAEAYELYIKALDYFLRQTKEGTEHAIQFSTEAIKLDSGYANAYQFKANALASLYRGYDRDPALLDEAETLSKEALRLKPNLFSVYHPLSKIYMFRGMLAEAEDVAKEYIRKDPQNFYSHFSLGFFYYNTGQYAKAIAPYEEAVRLNPDYLQALWNLASTCDYAGEREKCAHWATVALPQFERHIKLHPDDEAWLVSHAALLLMSGRNEDAHAAAIALKNVRDGMSLYNTACLFDQLGDPAESLTTFRKAIEAGFKNTRLLKNFLTDENKGIASLAATEEYEQVRVMVDELEAEQVVKKND